MGPGHGKLDLGLSVTPARATGSVSYLHRLAQEWAVGAEAWGGMSKTPERWVKDYGAMLRLEGRF